MNEWVYSKERIIDIDQFPSGSIGFIYRISNDNTGRYYIGKKNLYSDRNIPLGKKALAERTDKRASKKKKVRKESDWKTYYGSEPILKGDIDILGYEPFSREILQICSSKKSLTYQEIRHQIFQGVLENDKAYNSNILGKFFWQDAN